MNCYLVITRVKFVYLIDACVLRRKLNRHFHNKRRRRDQNTVYRKMIYNLQNYYRIAVRASTGKTVEEMRRYWGSSVSLL